MRYFLYERWSSEQIVLRLASIFPKGHEHRVSHETIYNCIYAQPIGKLIANLRHAHNKRVPRSKGQDRRGQISDMVSIHMRPLEIEDRQFPGHWEGRLIEGAADASAMDTLVERTSRLLILIKLPEFKPASAANEMQAFTDKLLGVAAPMCQSMTYDLGREMAMYKELSRYAEMSVYFCNPHSPWKCGSNENTNDMCVSTCPKELTSRATARSSLMPLPIRSTTGLVKDWAYDPRRPIENSCSTARNDSPSFIEPRSVALQT